MKILLPSALLACLALGACATGGQCASDTRYRNAASVEPIQGSDGVAVPDSPSALRIPPANRDEAVRAAPAKGNRRTSCLDFPPEMAAPAAK